MDLQTQRSREVLKQHQINGHLLLKSTDATLQALGLQRSDALKIIQLRSNRYPSTPYTLL